MEEARQNQIHPNRFRWTLLFGCGALATIAAAICLVMYINSHARYKFVGLADPVTGYHIEYTVSDRYYKTTADRLPGAVHFLEAWTFRRHDPPPPVRLFYDRVLHRPTPLAYTPGSLLGAFWIHEFQGGLPFGDRIDANGYPQFNYIKSISSTVSEEHCLVSGCPATFLIANLTVGPRRVPMGQYYCLRVKPKGQPVIYSIVGADYTDNPTGIYDEMIKIKNSIRITRTK